MIDYVLLRQFRSHSELKVEFSGGANLITGPNGSGKTSVTEAIYASLYGRSWRGSNEDLVQHQTDWATAEVGIGDDIYRLKLDGRSGKLAKQRLINDEPKRVGFPPVILLEPTMIDLVASGPSGRREWLDSTLSVTDQEYRRTLRQYERSLSQRNNLLKKQVRHKDQLFVWNIKLAELGAKLARARTELIDSSLTQINQLFETVAGYNKLLNINYQTKFEVDDYSQQFMNYLEQQLERDIAIGFTPTGPHREDIELTADSGPARDHLSRGEQLILAFALVYAQADTIKPVSVLLDDYTSDLDQEKSQRLIGAITQQKIVTKATMVIAETKEVAIQF